MITGYIGKVVDNHIFLICKDKEGNNIQCPHVEIFKDEGLTAISYAGKGTPKSPLKFLTEKEVALFFNGLDANGNLLEKPSEYKARVEAEHAKKMKEDPEYRKLFNEVMKKVWAA